MGDKASDLIGNSGEVIEDTTADWENPNEESVPVDELSGDETVVSC